MLSLLPNPYGIWSDGSTLWVSDFTEGKIYAYDLSWHQSPIDSSKKYAMGTFNADKKFDAYDYPDARNRPPKPQGIWANGSTAGSTMWIADDNEKRIFAYEYNGTTGKFERKNDSKDIWRQGNAVDSGFNDKDLTGLQGIWSDGETMWVVDNEGSRSGEEQKILAYSLTGSRYRDPAKDYRMLGDFGNDRPRGIWSDGETMWVADQTDNKLYAYHAYLALTSRNDKQDFIKTLKAAENNTPKGMWSDGQTLWVVDGDDNKLYAYNLATKARDFDKEIDLAESLTDLENEDNSDPSGIWSDRTTIWVADSGDDKLYAYNLATKARDSNKEIDLDSNNSNPSGLWANETIIWVADSVFTTTSTVDGKSITRKKLFAYKRELGEGETERRVPDKDIDLDRANSDPSDIWSDKTTMWMADTVDDKLYAYDLDTGDRVSSKDFGTLDSENTTPTGLWSDGATMWVVDNHPTNPKRDKIYAYRLSNAASLGALELTGHVPSKEYEDIEKVRLRPDFDSGTTRYKVSVPYSTESLTVEPKTLRPHDQVLSYSPEDADTTSTNTHQVSLGVGQNSLFITVTNGDTNTNSLPRTRTYKVDVTREFFTHNDPSKNIDLNLANSTPKGIFSDGTTLWVANDEDDKIYAYKLSDKSRDSGKDIALAVSTTSLDEEDNSHPRGIWANSTTMWVVDSEDDKIYAYKLELGEGETERRGADTRSKDIVLDSNNSDPQWVWSDGVTCGCRTTPPLRTL